MHEHKILKLLGYMFVVTICVTLVGTSSEAGTGALGEMQLLLKSSSSAGVNAGGDEIISESGEEETVNPEEKEEPKIEAGCGPEKVIAVETCEIGQGLLCLNTPPLSVTEKVVTVRGTVDRRTSIFSHMKVYVQHEYTKDFHEVEIGSWAIQNCWEYGWVKYYDACLDSKGFFGIKVPLSDYGPYTVMVDAVSVNGEATSKTIRTSLVSEAKLSREDISIDPDPEKNGGVINAKKINVSVDLLHGCTFCDFTGTSTGGVMITAENLITTNDGGLKRIVRHSNISKAGIFDVCVPVLSGQNHLSISACNAANEEGECSSIDNISFEVDRAGPGIKILSPKPGKKYAVLWLSFSVPG